MPLSLRSETFGTSLEYNEIRAQNNAGHHTKQCWSATNTVLLVLSLGKMTAGLAQNGSEASPDDTSKLFLGRANSKPGGDDVC